VDRGPDRDLRAGVRGCGQFQGDQDDDVWQGPMPYGHARELLDLSNQILELTKAVHDYASARSEK
jgi:hypothetical protein